MTADAPDLVDSPSSASKKSSTVVYCAMTLKLLTLLSPQGGQSPRSPIFLGNWKLQLCTRSSGCLNLELLGGNFYFFSCTRLGFIAYTHPEKDDRLSNISTSLLPGQTQSQTAALENVQRIFKPDTLNTIG